MWLGFFTSNFYENPMLKPIEMVRSDSLWNTNL